MEEKIVRPGPGTLIGISTDQAYRGALSIYNGTTLVMEVELDHAMRERQTKYGLEPGLDINLFCEHSIKLKYPKGAKIKAYCDESV